MRMFPELFQSLKIEPVENYPEILLNTLKSLTPKNCSKNRNIVILTPGPLTTSKLTKQAMLRDIGSWDSDFKKITSEIREKLVNILMQTSNINKIKNSDPYISIPMQGSGTFSVEAMLGTFVPKKK